MTAIFSLFQRAEISNRDAVVRTAAQSSVRIVSRQLAADTAAMSVAELRGYLRARAARVVRAQVELSISEYPLPSARIDEATAAALERTVHLLIKDLLAPPVIAIPTPHVRLRIAA